MVPTFLVVQHWVFSANNQLKFTFVKRGSPFYFCQCYGTRNGIRSIGTVTFCHVEPELELVKKSEP
jgi:hypothetical protein